MTSTKQVLLGIDIGTTGCTAIAITLNGQLVARSSADYPYFSPKPNLAEQCASDWWKAVVKTARECSEIIEQSGQEIMGLGIDSHLEAFVPVDVEGNVLAKGLLWIDQRTIPQAKELKHLPP